MNKTKTADVVVLLEGVMNAIALIGSRHYSETVKSDALDFGHDQWVNLLQYYRLDVLEYLVYEADPGLTGVRLVADMVSRLTRLMHPYDVNDFGSSRIMVVRNLLEDVGLNEYIGKLTCEMVVGSIADERRAIEIQRLRDQCKAWNDRMGELLDHQY